MPVFLGRTMTQNEATMGNMRGRASLRRRRRDSVLKRGIRATRETPRWKHLLSTGTVGEKLEKGLGGKSVAAGADTTITLW